MLELSARLTKTLENYGVKGDVVAIRPGPVVTMYEFAPAPGIRVAKIANLSDDLAMSLEALRVRIVAPIPGKAAVGIEVPNKAREKVFQPFQRLGDRSTDAGAGLGLAIAKGFVEVTGARLEVDDTPGGGCTFTITLPIAPASSSVSPEVHG